MSTNKISIMKKLILSILFVSLLVITACSNIDLSKVSEEDIDKVIKCDKPYIRFASGCCLDTDENKICDEDELDKDSDVKESNLDLGENPDMNTIFLDSNSYDSQIEITKNDFVRINFHDKMYGLKIEQIDDKGLLISTRDLKNNEEVSSRINKGGSSTLIPLEPTKGDSFEYYIEARLDSIETDSATFTFTKYENNGCKLDSDCSTNERCYNSDYIGASFCLDPNNKEYDMNCWSDKDCPSDSLCFFHASNLFTFCDSKDFIK